MRRRSFWEDVLLGVASIFDFLNVLGSRPRDRSPRRRGYDFSQGEQGKHVGWYRSGPPILPPYHPHRELVGTFEPGALPRKRRKRRR